MNPVLLHDTSVLLNLLATDRFDEIAKSFQLRFAICTAVRNETKALRDLESGEIVPIDFGPLLRSGILVVLEMNGEREQDLYIAQLASMDDGEAMSVAIAACRGMELAMDDRKSRKLTEQAFPSLKLRSTIEMLKEWSENANVAPDIMREVIFKIEGRARYTPGVSHPLYGWWLGFKHS